MKICGGIVVDLPPTSNGNAFPEKPSLAVQTQSEETRNTQHDNSPSDVETTARTSDSHQVQYTAPDGNESEDSAMLESPISERNASGGGEKATPSAMDVE